MSDSVVNIAGIPIVRGDVEAAVGRIVADAIARRGRVYVFVNAHSAKLRRDEGAYAALLSDPAKTAGLPDGASVTVSGRLVGYGDIGRTPGPDVFEESCERCAAARLPVYLLGGAGGVVTGVARALQERHRTLEVAGVMTPPFGAWDVDESRQLAESVRTSGARILFMGVSAPKQETWAYEHLDQLCMPVVCVGAAFDFISGAKSRAPLWMRRLGTEWVFRLIQEPGRLWKRYLVGNALFLWDVVRYGRNPAGR